MNTNVSITRTISVRSTWFANEALRTRAHVREGRILPRFARWQISPLPCCRYVFVDMSLTSLRA